MDQRPDDFEPARLRPEMASQRLLVLNFVRDYWGRWGGSPSQGEIAAGLRIHRDRVRRAVRSLRRDGLLLSTPGPRGLALPEAEEAAIRQLRGAGWTIDAAARRAAKAPLLPPAELDYQDPAEGGGTDDGEATGPSRGGRAQGA